MTIVIKPLLDHITVQFSYGGEHQLAKPGELEAAHFAEVEYLVDEATGQVMGKTSNPKNGIPQPLDPAKVAGVLGDKFAAFEQQQQDLSAKLAAAVQTALDATAAHAGTQTVLDDVAKQRDAAVIAQQAALQDNATLKTDLAAATSQIHALTESGAETARQLDALKQQHDADVAINATSRQQIDDLTAKLADATAGLAAIQSKHAQLAAVLAG